MLQKSKDPLKASFENVNNCIWALAIWSLDIREHVQRLGDKK